MDKKKRRLRPGQAVLGTVLGLYAMVCLLPLLLIIVVSFTDDKWLAKNYFSFFPESFSLNGWNYVINFGGQIGRAYTVTILVTVVGTAFALTVMSMFAYALSRRPFQLRAALTVFILIPMLFSGGQLAGYIVNTRYYHLKDNLLILIMPGVSTMNIVIFRTYIQNSIPEALIDSAKIDGAGEFYTFVKIIVPCMKPSLASVGFMHAMGLWNSWQQAYLYIDDGKKATLQLLLIKIEKDIQYLLERESEMVGAGAGIDMKNIPYQSGRMALLLTAIGPVVIAYPFFQKYFVKGLTVGAVKG